MQTSSSIYKSDIETKEELISTLKVENNLLKSKERDYSILNANYLDLESKYEILADEKVQSEINAKAKDDTQMKHIEKLKLELNELNGIIAGKNEEFKNYTVELSNLKLILDSKNNEIFKIKTDIKAGNSLNSKYLLDKNALENELAITIEGKKVAQGELDKLNIMNDSLEKEKNLNNERIQNLEIEFAQTGRKLGEIGDLNKLLSAEKRQLINDLNIQKEARLSHQKESDKMLLLNSKLLEEKKLLEDKASTLEYQLSQLDKKITETGLLIDSKEQELKTAKLSLNISEEKNLETKVNLDKLRKEKESLEILMNRYKNDALMNKKLRDEQTRRAIDLESEKNLLEKKVSNKEIEAYTAKKDLERIEESHKQLLSDHFDSNKELDALKEHTSLLENQNLNLHQEIDSIVITDSKVREDLNRKDKLQYIKSKNIEELQKSSEKVRMSTSPKKLMDTKSPYKSPTYK